VLWFMAVLSLTYTTDTASTGIPASIQSSDPTRPEVLGTRNLGELFAEVIRTGLWSTHPRIRAAPGTDLDFWFLANGGLALE
jgi:hypothetical protein